jgi:hypothetical protein
MCYNISYTNIQITNFPYPAYSNVLYVYINVCLKGQSHEKVYKFFTWDGSFSLN